MSTETTERAGVYQSRREAVARAIDAWQDAPELIDDDTPQGPLADADDLQDALMHEGLLILPRAATRTRWVVLVDGQPAREPVDAEDAAEVFLLAAAAADLTGLDCEIVVRPRDGRCLMTPERLAEIREREQKATPGPWGIGNKTTIALDVEQTGRGTYSCTVKLAEMAEDEQRADDLYYSRAKHDVACADDDAEFIAHARQDVSDLLAYVEQLEAALVDAQGRLADSGGQP